MRKLVVAAVTLGAMLALAGPANAITNRTLKVNPIPTNAGTLTAPALTSLNVQLITNETLGLSPWPGRVDDVYISKGFRLQKNQFPACSFTANTCPTTTQIGSGSAQGIIYDCANRPPVGQAGGPINVTIKLFNAPGNAIRASLSTGGTVILRILPAFGLYQYRLAFNVPVSITRQLGGCVALPFVSVTLPKKTGYINVRVRVAGRWVTRRVLRPLVSTVGCPGSSPRPFRAGSWSFRNNVLFTSDGYNTVESDFATVVSRCTP